MVVKRNQQCDCGSGKRYKHCCGDISGEAARAVGVEEQRICGFFDALGTKQIMLGNDVKRREALIRLVRKFSQSVEDYSANAQNLGLGVGFAPSAQVTCFSDNVAISLPLTQLELPGRLGNMRHVHRLEARYFFEHLLIQAVVGVWDGLKLGILMRGGISFGRLVHDGEIIAGEALVKAVELEKETFLPRIELDREIINLVDSRGVAIVSHEIRRDCLYEADGRWFVNVLGYHFGYWRDHHWFRQQQGLPPQSIPDALFEIRATLRKEFEMVKSGRDCRDLQKWEWFLREFDASFDKGIWPQIDGARDAVKRAANG